MTSHSMKKRHELNEARPAEGADSLMHAAPGRTVMAGPLLRGLDAAGGGFSGVMSRVCEMVWPVWPDMASSEHGADLASADGATLGNAACGTAVSRHAVLQRTPVAPVDQRRADCVPI